MDRKVWEDHSSEFRGKLDRLLKPGDVKAEDVSLFDLALGFVWRVGKVDMGNATCSMGFSLLRRGMRR